MKVQDIFTRDAKSCRPETNLSAAASIMWDNDCGIVPVTDAGGKVIGVLTDRDICMAAATQNRRASEIRVSEIMSGRLSTCGPDDDVRSALKTLRTAQVRRLPVVDAEGRLQGLLSLNDVVLAVRDGKGTRPGEPTSEDVTLTLKAICAHRTRGETKVPEEALAGRWD